MPSSRARAWWVVIVAASHIFLAGPVACFAAPSPEEDALQFERDCCKAFQEADTATLEKMLTHDFTLTLSNGEVSSRADEMGELRSGKVHYDIFENAGMKVRLYGNDTAVVIGQTRVKGTSDGKAFDHTVQFTDTLVKRDGRWQIAAGHVSPFGK